VSKKRDLDTDLHRSLMIKQKQREVFVLIIGNQCRSVSKQEILDTDVHRSFYDKSSMKALFGS